MESVRVSSGFDHHPYRNYDQDERSAFARVNIKRTGLVGETVSVYQRLRLSSTTSPMASLASTLLEGERGSNRGEGTLEDTLSQRVPVIAELWPAMEEQMGRLSSRVAFSRFVTRLADFFAFRISRNNEEGRFPRLSDTVRV